MSHTKEELITMQNNLGLGHKGEIILTTQQRVDENQPMIAKDVVDVKHAERLVLCWNSHNDLLAACKESQKRLIFLQRKIVEAKSIIMDGIEIRKTASCISFIEVALAKRKK